MKVADKLVKVDDALTIQIYDNGFMVEIPGRNAEDDWTTAKILARTIDDVHELLSEIVSLPKA